MNVLEGKVGDIFCPREFDHSNKDLWLEIVCVHKRWFMAKPIANKRYEEYKYIFYEPEFVMENEFMDLIGSKQAKTLLLPPRTNLWEGVSGVSSDCQKKATEYLNTYNEELMKRTCHPSRFVDWCLDIEEQKEMFNDSF